MKIFVAVLLAAILAVKTCSAQSSQTIIQPNNGTFLVCAVGVFVLVVGGIAVVECVHFKNAHLDVPNTFYGWPDEMTTQGSSMGELNGIWIKHKQSGATGGGYYRNSGSGFGMWLACVIEPWDTNTSPKYSWFITETPMGGSTLYAQQQFRDDTNTITTPPMDWKQPWLTPVHSSFTNANPPVAQLPWVSDMVSAGPTDEVIEANQCEVMDADKFMAKIWGVFGPRIYVPFATNENMLVYSNLISLGLNGQTDYTHTNWPCMKLSGGTLYLSGSPTNDHNWYAGWFQLGWEAPAGSSLISSLEGFAPMRVLVGADGVLQRSYDLKTWQDMLPVGIVASNITVIVLDEEANPTQQFYRLKP